METTYFTFTACGADVSRSSAAAGGTCRRRLAYTRPDAGQGAGKVIDLERWRADHGAAPPPGDAPGEGGPSRSRRGGGRHRRDPMRLALQAAELLATLSIVGMMAAMAVRLLVL